MRKYLLILLGSLFVFLCWAKPDLIYRYWFDDNNANMVEGKATGEQLHIDADVSSLSESLHILHLQVFDDDTPGAIASHLFVKSPLADVNGLRYWFDNDIDKAHTISNAPGPIDIDVSSLKEGLHVLNMQTAGNSPSPVRSSMFIKVPQTLGTEYVYCVTYVDGQLYKNDKVAPNGGLIHYDMPISELSTGLHSLSVQLVTSTGGASELKNCFFLRHITGNEISRMRCFYSVDGLTSNSEAAVFESGDFHFDVDVSSVSDGLHSITYMLNDADGSVSEIKTGMFYKIPLGGYGLSEYWYWINDRNDAITKVDIDGIPENLDLIALLPVESQPFRSSLFHFEIDKNGQPCVYAANEFHFRVYSNDLHSTEMSKVYTDYSVSRKVEDVAALDEQSGSVRRQYRGENDILWYRVNAEIGDSLSLRTDNASVLQVFDPKGNEVFSAEGVDVTAWSGMHLQDEGAYYIAVHDVPSSRSNVTLDYNHIAKYAVLGYTPDEAGATDGDVCISITGNGYDKLKDALLSNGVFTLDNVKIEVFDKYHARLKFKLKDDTKRDMYDLKLVFEDKEESETLTLEKAFTVADPVYGNIEVDIYDYPISVIPQPVAMTITNTGNVAYKNIPVELGWSTENLNAWNLGMDLKSDAESAANSTNPFFLVDSLNGKDEKGAILPVLIDRLESGESANVILWYDIDIGTGFNMDACVFRPWNLGSDTSWFGKSGEYGPETTDGKEPVDDYDWTYVYGDDEGNCDMTLEEVEEMLESSDVAVDNGYDVASELSSLKNIPTMIGSGQASYSYRVKYKVIRKTSRNRKTRTSKVTYKWIRSNMSYDPNDILGYVSPADTHYIKRGLKDVFYTVEFENDSTVATAAAHHIKVTNEIDKSKLDISTLKSKLLKISNKTVDLSELGRDFVTTVDMRPEINVIAQLTQSVDIESGVVQWDILALDPMTLEPTVHYMQGILPVNDSDGRGMGEIIYDISLKDGLADGTSITNKASIVFDDQDPIVTPIWENIIDSVDPKSRVSKAVAVSDDKALLTIEGSDNRSGIWHYDIYCHKPGEEEWTQVGEGVTTDDNKEVTVNIPACDNLEFCALAYDCAGNKETKTLRAETSLAGYILGDANNDGLVTVADYTAIINHIIGKPNSNFLFAAADVDGDGKIMIGDATSIVNLLLGKIKKLPKHEK